MSDTLTLTVNGQDFTIYSPPAKVGLALQASYVITLAKRKQTDPPAYALERAARYDTFDRSLDEDALSGTSPDGVTAWDAMLEADVPLSELRKAARAAYVWIVTGSDTAARAVMDPDTPRQETGSGKASTTTAEATTTPPPDSTTGTTSHPESSSA
ncbi:DUF7426 family protein [Ornithinimicrobium sufpigmenti]|uniref:DUF7426 family protein n=1 Tax=Ornithinimicrobium sufpigmenti TaxID=2508882 RepID=UPI0015E16EC2|nr:MULTISPECIES: hypothetical protein [unclassified Ornithinimicrobium]